MSLLESAFSSEYIPIPAVFRSSETGEPLTQCLVCNKFLLKEGTQYMIEKAIRQFSELNLKEVIFEYAICLECITMMNNSLSEESLQRIQGYMVQHGGLVDRKEKLLRQETLDVQPWISSCLIKGTPISKCVEYQLVAQCDGENLLFTYTPFAISIEALNEMAELLSNKSLGEMDDFIGRYFSGPPEIAEWLKKNPVLLA